MYRYMYIYWYMQLVTQQYFTSFFVSIFSEIVQFAGFPQDAHPVPRTQHAGLPNVIDWAILLSTGAGVRFTCLNSAGQPRPRVRGACTADNSCSACADFPPRQLIEGWKACKIHANADHRCSIHPPWERKKNANTTYMHFSSIEREKKRKEKSYCNFGNGKSGELFLNYIHLSNWIISLRIQLLH